MIESIISCGLSNDDPAPIYESGKLYYFSQYSSIFARYNELDEQGVDPSEIFNLDKGFKDSKRLSMHGMEKELTEGLQTNFKKTSKMANLKYLIVVQHPRQYALEGFGFIFSRKIKSSRLNFFFTRKFSMHR